jgi:flagellar basal body-associated protein FliL
MKSKKRKSFLIIIILVLVALVAAAVYFFQFNQYGYIMAIPYRSAFTESLCQ